MSKSIVMATPAAIELDPEPLPPEWILSGNPEARGKMLVRSHDWSSTLVVWNCTSGSFRWHFSQDEVIFVISGAAFLLNDDGSERRFGAGELGFFPAGTTCKWRIDDHFLKIAVLRETMWRPLGLCLKVWNKLLRIVGLKGKSPL